MAVASVASRWETLELVPEATVTAMSARPARCLEGVLGEGVVLEAGGAGDQGAAGDRAVAEQEAAGVEVGAGRAVAGEAVEGG